MERFEKVSSVDEAIKNIYECVSAKNKGEVEFLQAFYEILYSLRPVFVRDSRYLSVLKTIVEPERVIMFRVPWLDDSGKQRINRGYRVQYSSALGPYKGGLRFHPTVNLSIIKFLGLEQILKNSLTTLPLGAGKGGSDFDPKGKSDGELMRFCQSFMTSLYSHVGSNVDVPAGDIGVGGKEIGYLFGQYKRLTRNFEGVLTGKNLSWGGSLIRAEATGYGAVYFGNHCLANRNLSFKNMRCVISGSGNVAQFTVEKLIELGGKCLTMSDSSGYILDDEGFSSQKLEYLKQLKNIHKSRIQEYCIKYPNAKFFAGEKPWKVSCDAAFPSATQNEIKKEDAELLCKNKCIIVVEGANMPCDQEAVHIFKNHNVIFCPGKAANAGGVAVSGLEMAQNSQRINWTREEVDIHLQRIMKSIFTESVAAAKEYGFPDDLQFGANIAGFLRVANAVIDQGCV